MKRAAGWVAIALVSLAGVLMGRGVFARSHQVAPGARAPIQIDPAVAAQHLAGAVRLRTISWPDVTQRDAQAFLDLHDYLARTFPRVAATLTREVVGTYSLLYTWRGTRDDLAPLILCAHLDVVPADAEPEPDGAAATTAAQWTHPPFSGDVAGGRVWGRGTLDDKGAAVGLLEAVESLLAAGVRPSRTIYLAFSHNEERGGEPDADPSGAAALASVLASRGVRGAWLLGEGGFILRRVPGVTRPVALVGIAEKGFATIELTVRTAGGHSSMPPDDTAIGLLAEAIARVAQHPMPARLDGPAEALFTSLAADAAWPSRGVFANLWLLRPIVRHQLTRRPDTNALVRTTIAPTIVSGGVKSNVLATSARAVLNVRLLPGDAIAAVVAHVREAIDDPRVEVSGLAATAPVEVSPAAGPAFDALARAVRSISPDILVAPFLTVAATDAREFAAVAPFAYRLAPIPQDDAPDRLHAVNESIDLAAYVDSIRAYAAFMIAN